MLQNVYSMFKRSCFYTVGIVLIFFCSSFNQTQKDKRALLLKGIVEDNYEPLDNAKITVYQNSRKLKNIESSKDGLFNFELDLNKKYSVEFSKVGYVSKKVEVNSSLPVGITGTWRIEFSISLFQMYPGLDVSILEDPITKIKYKKQTEDFGYEEDYTDMMMNKLEKLLAQLENLREAAYRQCIQRGDQYFNRKEYEKSIDNYRNALDHKPKERYPKKQITTAKKLLKEKLERCINYRNAIAKADSFFKEKKYQNARLSYFEAVKYDHSKEYPVKQIGKIDRILKQKQPQKLSADRIQNRYHQYIELADNQFKEENYIPAKISYQNALGVFPDKQYPKDQIDTLNQVLAKKAQRSAKIKKYQKLIDQGDESFSQKKYTKAKSSYSKALEILPGEAYPKNKISYIEYVLSRRRAVDERYNSFIEKGNTYFHSGRHWLARNAYQKALEIKPDEKYPRQRIGITNGILQSSYREQQYRYMIEKADENFERENYKISAKNYRQALDTKPTSDYARNRIDKINDKMTK